MKKIDLKKDLKHLYGAAAKTIAIVDVPAMNFLMIDGQGDPNTSDDYQGAVEALYAVSYAAKFMIKKGSAAIDYGVMPLEGLWWTDDPAQFSPDNKGIWKWTAMIMQPEWVTATLWEEAKAQTAKKKNPRGLPKMRLESFREGKAAQILYVGPYTEEAPTISRLHKFIEEQGLKRCGRHHEIYLNDPRRTDPAKLRTILRQPVAAPGTVAASTHDSHGQPSRST
ncbi:MAG: GyrI-like domain-containing protein [Alphaproteobacteria bacterium]|nr:GyrI-like domain-containing protein [Alphaproteobacteria bacterium]